MEAIPRSPRALFQWVMATPFLRYSMVSAVAVVVNQTVLFGAQFHTSARSANIWAVCISAIPSYQLNRSWVWGRSGRSNLMREIIPFWVMALLGLIISTWFADYAGSNAYRITQSGFGQKLIVNFAAFASFGLLWVGKYVVFKRILFAPEPVLDERSR